MTASPRNYIMSSKARERSDKEEKGYSTGYSQAVTHPSTNPACGCLTSEIERDRVHSTEYGRIHPPYIFLAYIALKKYSPSLKST